VILKVLSKELDFLVGRDETAASSIKLENISKEVIAFKVKTTAPRRYTVRPNSGLITPGETTQVKVSLPLAREPKRSSEPPDKFQVLSVLVNVTPENKPPRPDDGNYADYLRRLWKAATPDKLFKDRLKINIKRDPLREATKSSRLTTTKNLSSRLDKTDPKKNGTLTKDISSLKMRSVSTIESAKRESSRPPAERPRESSRAPRDRARESSRAPKERSPDRGRSISRSKSPDRSRVSTSEIRARAVSRSRDRTRGESVGPPRDRERSRSRKRDDYRERESRSRSSSRTRERERDRDRDRSRSPDRGRSSRSSSRDPYDRSRDYYDRSRSRGRRSDDDGYLSSREYSRSPSRSRGRDERSSRSRSRDYRSRSRSASTEYRQKLESNNRELDTILRRYEVLNVKTAQKGQERQLLFVALAFFIGFIFAQGILY